MNVQPIYCASDVRIGSLLGESRFRPPSHFDPVHIPLRSHSMIPRVCDRFLPRGSQLGHHCPGRGLIHLPHRLVHQCGGLHSHSAHVQCLLSNCLNMHIIRINPLEPSSICRRLVVRSCMPPPVSSSPGIKWVPLLNQ